MTDSRTVEQALKEMNDAYSIFITHLTIQLAEDIQDDHMRATLAYQLQMRLMLPAQSFSPSQRRLLSHLLSDLDTRLDVPVPPPLP